MLALTLLIFVHFSLNFSFKKNSFDSKLHYFRFDPSLTEWSNSFPNAPKDSYGPIHLWLRCSSSKIRGILFVESQSDYDHRIDDTASYLRKYWNDNEKSLNIHFNDENVPFESSILPWPGSYSSSSAFQYDLSRTNSSEYLNIRINNWRRYHKLDIEQACKPQILLQEKNQLFLAINFADKSNSISYYHSIKNHLIYHEANFHIDRYLLVVREFEVKLIMKDPFLLSAVKSGFIQIFVKPNYLPEVSGHSFRWQAVYENLLLLYYWTEGTKLLILDVDEFVVSSKPLLHYLAHNESCMSFNRIHLFCSGNCSGQTDKENVLIKENKDSWHQVVGNPKFDHGKLLIDPQRTDCVYVHFSVCGKPCGRVDESEGKILHFINYFERRSTLLSVGNTSAYPLTTEFIDELRTDDSRQVVATKGHASAPSSSLRRVRSLKDNHSRQLQSALPLPFHLIWTTGKENFQNWRIFVLLSIQRAHRKIEYFIRIYSNSLTIAHIQEQPDGHLLNMSLIEVVPIDNALFSDTPLSNWWQGHTELHGSLTPSSSDHRYSHLTDIVRLAALWKAGGVYLDFDMLVLRSLSVFRNSLASQKDSEDRRITDSSDPINLAIAVFQRGHGFLQELMQGLPAAYDPTCWSCVGPRLVSQAVDRWTARGWVLRPLHLPDGGTGTGMGMDGGIGDNGSISVYPHAWFYPLYWKRGGNLVTRKSFSANDYRRLMSTAVSLHLWSHATNFTSIQKGSTLDLIMAHLRDDLPLSGYSDRRKDDLTRQQHLSMTDGTPADFLKSVLPHERRKLEVSKTPTILKTAENENYCKKFVDFNSMAMLGYRANIPAENVFICPVSERQNPSVQNCPKVGSAVNRQLLEKNVEYVRPVFLSIDRVVLFCPIGRQTDFEALHLWLPLLEEENLQSGLSTAFIFVLEACSFADSACMSPLVPIMSNFNKRFKTIKFNNLRLNVNVQNNGQIKLKSIARALVTKFASAKYFVRVDADALLLPRRLTAFLSTLHAVSRSERLPVQFGNLFNTKLSGHPDRVVSGWNNLAFNETANGRTDGIYFVQCGGFLSVPRWEKPSQWEMRRTITYRQPDLTNDSESRHWLRKTSARLTDFYHDPNEWISETDTHLIRDCVDFNEIGKRALSNGLRSEDLYVCPSVHSSRIREGTQICNNSLRLSDSQSAVGPFKVPLQTDDVLVFIAVGRKYLRSEVPALFWWLGLLDKEGPQVRVTSDIVLLADSCKEDTDTSDAYSQLQAGNCSDGAKILRDSLASTFRTLRFHLSRVHFNHRTNLAQKMLFGSKAVYNAFPTKKYYFKVDDDTIVFPTRLASFLRTLEAGTRGGGWGDTPLYFGTVHDRLPFTMDWAQGGSGYGLNNRAMRNFVASTPPVDHFGFGTSEDYFLWSSLSRTNRSSGQQSAAQLLHCGGFFANTVNDTSDWHFSSSITFHRIKGAAWLHRFGDLLASNYQKYPTVGKLGFIDSF